ncbi:MAG: ATP-binding protein [Chlamydiia bacterium]|nr:ATP-binding protein [Chlamydiia bacterium]HPE84616.1 AAA family ATPase [Chlamydiales bacterium]
MYQRLISKSIPEKKSFFLFGPRGTGKTHWVKSAFPNAIYIDLLEESTFQSFLKSSSLLDKMIPDGFDDWIIIDEVQKVPQILNEVHRLIELKDYCFILTGSSARTLRKKGVNLLAGRALLRTMHPLCAQELGSDFTLDRSLKYGHLPSVFSESDPSDYLKSYIGVYLKEEVMQEGLTRKLDAFAKALEILSFSQGSMINYSEIAREIGVDRRLVTGYIDVMVDLLLAVRLPIFSRRAKRKLITNFKFYFFDVGVYRSLRPTGPFDQVADLEGAALETLFFQELRAVNDYYGLNYSLYFWRTQSKLEVDFILYGERGFFAFEIKRSKNICSKDLKALNEFIKDYPEVKAFIVYGGDRKLYFGKITALPFVEAIQTLPILLESYQK